MSPEKLTSKQKKRRDRLGPEALARVERLKPVFLEGTESVFEHQDDLHYLELARRQYWDSFVIDRVVLGNLQVFKSLGVPEQIIRDGLSNQPDGLKLALPYISGASQFQIMQIRQTVSVVSKATKLYLDEDDSAITQMVSEGTDIPIVDLYSEKVRAKSESISLLDLQLDWLRKLKRRERKAKMNPSKPEIVKEGGQDQYENVPEEADEVRLNETVSVEGSVYDAGLSLEGRSLFWTRRFFSRDPNHLVPISTGSRNSALGELSQLAMGQASVKEGSILSALEFHLRKDVIQRALATRNKYGPEGIRDWVKIKRGGDRIFVFLPPDEPDKLIFFAASRDVVYRGI